MRKPLIALLCCPVLLVGCKQDLLIELSQAQANRVVATLQRHHIDAQKKAGEKSRYAVTVEKSDFPAAAGVIDAYGLPGKDDVEISAMFPADAVVSTPTAERARLLSGIEQRLEQSIQAVDEVVNARVHVSYGTAGDDHGAAAPLRVSALVVYENQLEENLFLEKVKRLLKNSFSELRYEDISVVLFKRDAPKPLAARQSKTFDGWMVGALAGGVALLGALGGALLFMRKKIAPLRGAAVEAGNAPPPSRGETMPGDAAAPTSANAAPAPLKAAPTPPHADDDLD